MANLTDQHYREKMLSMCIETASGCLEWQGFRHERPRNYGVTSYFGKRWRTHRLAYKLWNGDIPAGMHVLHSCDNPPCCNPAHLSLGTHKENMRECREKGRYHYANLTHCKNGHEFNAANTYIIKTPGEAQGLRACRACQRARQRMRAGWTREEAFAGDVIKPGTVTKRRTFKFKKRRPSHVEASPNE